MRFKFTGLLVLVVALFAPFAMMAQEINVSGTVTSSEDGLPMPGVSIIIVGTQSGTSSDFDGNFSISANTGDQLQFSFIGFSNKSVAVTGATLNVVLDPDAAALDEVVVTALGISREKKSLGYATQGVKSEDLMAANSVDAMSSLSGKVAGLTVSGQNFGGSQNILIRGASSFSGSNQPLFVVDGIPISNENFNTTSTQNGSGGYDYGSMSNDINSYDIENVEVLKGSAASALYGSRGQNGVIMITTKQGKSGKKSFSVDINTGITFESLAILPDLQTSYGGGHGFDDVTVDGTQYQAVQYAVDESWGPKYEGQQVIHWWGAEDYAQGLTSAPVTGAWKAPDNDVDAFYETGVTYQNSINIVSTSETSAIRLGYANVSMTGTVPNSSQDKNSFNLNGTQSLFDGFIDVNANISFVNTKTKGRPQSGYGDNSQSQKFFQWGQRQLDFNKLSNYKNADGTMRTWNRKSFENSAPKYSDNPYWTAYENYQSDERTRVFGTTGIKINITDYLSAVGNVFLDTYTFSAEERTSIGSQSQSFYSLANRQGTETNFEGKLNFQKTFSDLSVLAMLGSNVRNNDYNRMSGESNGGLVVPGIYNLSNSKNQSLVTQFNRYKQVKSVFGMASVGYQNFAYLEGTYRTDWDSSLPNDANKYSYMSISGSVIISELIDVEAIDNLKVRANYGETGNGTDPYSVYNTYFTDTPFNGNPMFTNYITLNNNNLQPEETSEIEFGLEGAFYGNRIGFDFSWYSRDTKNQIVPVEVSGANGYTKTIINAGNINNSGIELMLYGTPVRTEDFSWNIDLNFARNVNLVKDLPGGSPEDPAKIQLARAPFGGAYLNAVEGATFQELYALNYVYDANGNKVINQSTGFYEQGKLESVGSVLPDWTGGLRNTFTYKSFDLGVLIDASMGGKYYSLSNMWGMYSGMLEKTATPTSGGNTIREDGLVLDGVTPDGAKNEMNISGIDYAQYHYHGFGMPSATSVFDASYMKLREVTFGYTLPKLHEKIQSVKLSVYGRNLATWSMDSDGPGIDPETIVGGNGNIQGLEGGIIPSTRSYGFNLQIKF